MSGQLKDLKRIEVLVDDLWECIKENGSEKAVNKCYVKYNKVLEAISKMECDLDE